MKVRHGAGACKELDVTRKAIFILINSKDT